MLIRSRRRDALRASDVTPEELYLRRREFLDLGARGVAAAATLLYAGCDGLAADPGPPASPTAGTSPSTAPRASGDLATVKKSRWRIDEPATDYDSATSYNNFYEFGTDKTDPARYSHSLVTTPWQVRVGGLCAKPGNYDVEQLLPADALEERIYRLRCVEAWSMVIPWVGVGLGEVLKRLEPSPSAKFVEFRTLHAPEQMPGQRSPILDWPYREGLRLDEAMHPLAMLAIGMYGRVLPKQNGAPLRLVVPWKYGFKSIKSIVAIEFSDRQPATTWNAMAAEEYGFYANVNPAVSHPRWSQKRERRIGEWGKRETLPFNGYADEVASLYAGMDLTVSY